jgi:hypothetical protein
MNKSGKPIPSKVSKGSESVLDRLIVLNRTQMHAVIATESEWHVR